MMLRVFSEHPRARIRVSLDRHRIKTMRDHPVPKSFQKPQRAQHKQNHPNQNMTELNPEIQQVPEPAPIPNVITIVTKKITVSPFFFFELISHYSYSRAAPR